MKKLAIVGRPNVGKSALFNRICGKRIAIVDEAEGITRDRLYAPAEAFGFSFEVIDTGGIDPQSTDTFQEQISRQAQIAIEEADRIVLVVDGQVGVTELDLGLARTLLKTDKRVVVAVNKIDSLEHQHLEYPFRQLGIREMVGVSAVQNHQVAELLELVWEGEKEEADGEDRGPKVALVGRPNVGKSTLVNALLDEERCIVNPVAGTTRDSVDIPFEREGKGYVLIDTAGIRRVKTEREVVERFSAMRTERAIERADVCLLMIDAREGLTTQDKKIAQTIERAGRACIILLNKWDLVKGFQMEHCLRALKEESPFLGHAPTLFVSAQEGRNLEKIFPAIEEVLAAAHERLPTSQLNTFLERTMQLTHPPMLRGKRLRVYYMTQVGTAPPRFLLFVNHPTLMTRTYKKYLLNQFRKKFTFAGNPLSFTLKGKGNRSDRTVKTS